MDTYRPTSRYRKNSLSNKPTNTVIKVVFEKHEVIYDNIHYPEAFVDKILKNVYSEWKEIWLNDKQLYERSSK